jgi:hypothetical protein
MGAGREKRAGELPHPGLFAKRAEKMREIVNFVNFATVWTVRGVRSRPPDVLRFCNSVADFPRYP